MTHFSFHTHSSFCDGKMTPETYVLHAISLGMSSIGFSSHAPLHDNFVWAMKSDNLESYLSEIERLKKKYEGEITIFLSLEIDYVPGVSQSFEKWKQECALDYTIGSVHLVKAGSERDFWFLDGPDRNYSKGINELFYGDVQKAVSSYYNQVIEMIKEQKPDVIGHIDKVKMNNKNIFFDEKEDWYIDLLDRTLASVEESNCIVEVNTRGIYKKKSQELFPDSYFLEQCYRRKIRMTISSDAHHPDELIAGFDTAKKRLKDIGFEYVYVFFEGEWMPEPI
ncbi:histidinol-phosphatase HisJ [Marinifilum sp. RC60d5]|uniref:histidinol-phosphatase HisJ n=1 Tax=Marinifilum sp. RC60d5 TaxID=3458414 RepID=UPI004035E7EF